MSIALRFMLMLGSAILFIFIARKLKKSQLQLMDAFFWIVFSFVILVLSLFPDLGIILADLLGVQSASNFIFLCIITLLLIKSFLQAIKVSSLEQKVINLTQEIAISKNIEKLEIKDTK